jgi:hypothetical protein
MELNCERQCVVEHVKRPPGQAPKQPFQMGEWGVGGLSGLVVRAPHDYYLVRLHPEVTRQPGQSVGLLPQGRTGGRQGRPSMRLAPRPGRKPA